MKYKKVSKRDNCGSLQWLSEKEKDSSPGAVSKSIT